MAAHARRRLKRKKTFSKRIGLQVQGCVQQLLFCVTATFITLMKRLHKEECLSANGLMLHGPAICSKF